jgi:murein DD-endopeptidase MepM/ murein hydrolase activator NlpD
MRKLELAYPLRPVFITQPFGVNGEYYQKNGINIVGHNGIDMLAKRGQPVFATHDGQVVYAGMDDKGGWGVVIRTNEPRQYKDGEAFYKTIYWHLLPNISVRVGEQVRVGEVIGYADSTGLSTGDHLHFGLKPQAQGENDWTWVNLEEKNGYFGAIDPMLYFNGLYADDFGRFYRILQSAQILLASITSTIKNRKIQN